MPRPRQGCAPHAIVATREGRSISRTSQQRPVLPLPVRGALDTGATEINAAMKMAAVRAIADLAMAEPSDVVRRAYAD